MNEIEDFSPTDDIPSYSLVIFSLPSLVSHEGNIRFFPNGSYTILLLNRFFLIIPSKSFNQGLPRGSKHQDYSWTYPLGIRYAGTVEKLEVEIEIKVIPRQEPH